MVTAENKRFEVVIAGGGVAALEALLALRRLLAGRADVALLAPEREFVYRPLAVAEPFGFSAPERLPLVGIARDLAATHVRDALAGLDPNRRLVRTRLGAALPYDALLLAIGARADVALPGALTYRGPADNAALRRLLLELEQGQVRQLVFAVPQLVRWPLPLYELALMTANRLAAKGVEGAELALLTPESRPLGVFGSRASESVRALLGEAGIRLRTSAIPTGVEPGRVVLASGRAVPAERTVALPRLSVAPIPGVPQGPRGFIDTDRYMEVEGLARVYAAGDATWFPVKQGGLAAQQADVAAASIAACVNPAVERAPFRPVLRAALLTGQAPRYLRSQIDEPREDSTAAAAPLWWPPSKIAGRYLAPYLARVGRLSQPAPPLEDLESLQDEDLAETEAEHRDAVELALSAADADARWRDYGAALHWLDVAEQLDMVLPPAYAEKRSRWKSAAVQA